MSAFLDQPAEWRAFDELLLPRHSCRGSQGTGGDETKAQGQVGCPLVGVRQYGDESGNDRQHSWPEVQQWVPQQVCAVMQVWPAHGATTQLPWSQTGAWSGHWLLQLPQL